MTEDLKVCVVFAAFFICISSIALLLDYYLQREAKRQFYRDLVRLVLLFEQSDLLQRTIQVPMILGPRIVRYAAYQAIINDLSQAYYGGSTDYHSLLAYVLSLHKFYCYSYRDLIKFKNKLLKEKTLK